MCLQKYHLFEDLNYIDAQVSLSSTSRVPLTSAQLQEAGLLCVRSCSLAQTLAQSLHRAGRVAQRRETVAVNPESCRWDMLLSISHMFPICSS